MRGPDPGFRRTAVLLLLAPRARERTVHEEGGLRRARRLRKGQVGSLAPDRRLLPEGGAGVREEAISDREPDHGGSYLYLEVQVRRRAGSPLPSDRPSRGGESLSRLAPSSRRAPRGETFRRIRSRLPSGRVPPVHGRLEDGPLRHGDLLLPLLLLPGVGREDVQGRRVRG